MAQNMDTMEKTIQDDSKRVDSAASEAGEGSQLVFDKAIEKAYGMGVSPAVPSSTC